MTFDWLFLSLIALYFAWRFLTIWQARREIPRLLQRDAQIVDVRSPREFDKGHPVNAVNIPLAQIERRAAEELDLSRPVLVCCESGSRSALAASKLDALGFDVANAGSWKNLPRG